MSDNTSTVTLAGREVLHIHDKLERLSRLEIDFGMALSENLKLRLALSVALAIAEQRGSPRELRTCAVVRQVLGEAPTVKSGSLMMPFLIVDNTQGGP